MRVVTLGNPSIYLLLKIFAMFLILGSFIESRNFNVDSIRKRVQEMNNLLSNTWNREDTRFAAKQLREKPRRFRRRILEAPTRHPRILAGGNTTQNARDPSKKKDEKKSSEVSDNSPTPKNSEKNELQDVAGSQKTEQAKISDKNDDALNGSNKLQEDDVFQSDSKKSSQKSENVVSDSKKSSQKSDNVVKDELETDTKKSSPQNDLDKVQDKLGSESNKSSLKTGENEIRDSNAIDDQLNGSPEKDIKQDDSKNQLSNVAEDELVDNSKDNSKNSSLKTGQNELEEDELVDNSKDSSLKTGQNELEEESQDNLIAEDENELKGEEVQDDQTQDDVEDSNKSGEEGEEGEEEIASVAPKMSKPAFNFAIVEIIKNMIESWFGELEFTNEEDPSLGVNVNDEKGNNVLIYRITEELDENIEQNMLTIEMENEVYTNMLRIQVLKRIDEDMIVYINDFLTGFLMKSSQIVIKPSDLSSNMALMLTALYSLPEPEGESVSEENDESANTVKEEGSNKSENTVKEEESNELQDDENEIKSNDSNQIKDDIIKAEDSRRKLRYKKKLRNRRLIQIDHDKRQRLLANKTPVTGDKKDSEKINDPKDDKTDALKSSQVNALTSEKIDSESKKKLDTKSENDELAGDSPKDKLGSQSNKSQLGTQSQSNKVEGQSKKSLFGNQSQNSKVEGESKKSQLGTQSQSNKVEGQSNKSQLGTQSQSNKVEGQSKKSEEPGKSNESKNPSGNDSKKALFEKSGETNASKLSQVQGETKDSKQDPLIDVDEDISENGTNKLAEQSEDQLQDDILDAKTSQNSEVKDGQTQDSQVQNSQVQDDQLQDSQVQDEDSENQKLENIGIVDEEEVPKPVRRFIVDTENGEEIKLNEFYTQEELDDPKVIMRFYDTIEQSEELTHFKLVTNDPNFDVIDLYFRKGENNEYELTLSNSYFLITNKFNIPTKRFMLKSLENLIETVNYRLTNVRKINHMMIKDTSEMILDFDYPILMFRKCAWEIFGFYLTHKVKGLKDFEDLVLTEHNRDEGIAIFRFKDNRKPGLDPQDLLIMTLKRDANEQIETVTVKVEIFIIDQMRDFAEKMYPHESMFNMFAMLESLMFETLNIVKHLYYLSADDMIHPFGNPSLITDNDGFQEIQPQMIDIWPTTIVPIEYDQTLKRKFVMGPAYKTDYVWKDTIVHEGKYGYHYKFSGKNDVRIVHSIEFYLYSFASGESGPIEEVDETEEQNSEQSGEIIESSEDDRKLKNKHSFKKLINRRKRNVLG